MRGLRKSRKLLGLLLGCLLLLTGCREVEDVIAPAQPESTPLLTVLVDQLPDSLDPLTATTTEGAALANYLCDGLLEFNSDTGRPGPCLARSWDVSEDGLTLTLYLETSAAFADGAAVNAQAVVQNIQRWQSDGSDGLKEQLSAIQSVRASGTSQVVLTLFQPDAGLFAVFCSPETGLVSPNVIQDGTAAQDPKGAGSYQLQNKQDWTIVLARREDYFRGTTPHQQVEFRVTSPAQAQEWMAQSEDYLAIGGLVSDITVNGSYQRYTATGLTSYQLYLNLQRLPLNTVRQLVGQTVQAKATVPSGFLDQGGLLPDAVYQGEDLVFSANTNATLAQYSFSSMILICPDDPVAIQLAQQVQQALSTQYCSVEIQSLDQNAFAQAVSQGEYHLCLFGETILDCSDWLDQFTASDSDPSHLQNDSMSKWAQWLTNLNYDKARNDELEEFCSMLAQQAAVVPLCQNGISILASREYYLDPWGCFLA